MGQIYYRKRIEGVTIPAVIHNSSYFLIQLPVYEDGTVDCWQRCDMEQFQEKLHKGWVTPQIPTGKSISIHALGDFTIVDARWSYDTDRYYQHVLEVVKQLNPEMQNIYRVSKREKEKWEKNRVIVRATPIDFKVKEGFGYFAKDGDSKYVFYRKAGKLYLTPLQVYEDKSLRLEMEGAKDYSLEEILKMFDEGILTITPKGQEWVVIDGLGEVLLGEDELPYVDVQEKKKEIKEMVSRVANEPDAHDRCVQAYHRYLEEPCAFNREQLRKAYEEVPEHERMYLGDMDTKDSDYRRILYYPNSKREV